MLQIKTEVEQLIIEIEISIICLSLLELDF